MKIRVGINGIGRIGRHILKICTLSSDIEVVGINEINPDIENWCYMLNYDCIYGKSSHDEKNYFKATDKGIVYTGNNKVINAAHCVEIDEAPWSEWGADFVIDCTGVKRNVIKSRNLIDKRIVKKVFISHSPGNELVDFTMVVGANHEQYKHDEHNLIASSICDATAIAPITRLINDRYKISGGYVTTLHPWLSYQNLLDGSSSSWSVPGEIYHHYALGRSAINNLIPKPTSAMDAVFTVLPEIHKETIGSFSYRTPTSIIASSDITFIVERETNKDDLESYLCTYEKNQEYPIIKTDKRPLVSMDYVNESYSAVVDLRWLNVVNKNIIKVVLWYDNEYGYSSNVIRQLRHVNQFY